MCVIPGTLWLSEEFFVDICLLSSINHEKSVNYLFQYHLGSHKKVFDLVIHLILWLLQSSSIYNMYIFKHFVSTKNQTHNRDFTKFGKKIGSVQILKELPYSTMYI